MTEFVRIVLCVYQNASSKNFIALQNLRIIDITPNTSVIIILLYFKWHLIEGINIILDWRNQKLPQQLMTCYKTDNIKTQSNIRLYVELKHFPSKQIALSTFLENWIKKYTDCYPISLKVPLHAEKASTLSNFEKSENDFDMN